jgi:hypothetical protein
VKKELSPIDQTVCLRMKADRLTALDAFAKQHGMSRTAVIQVAVERLLKKGL